MQLKIFDGGKKTSKEENKLPADVREFLSTLKNLVMLLAVLWLTFAFILGIKMAPNDDMVPRISAGDILVYYRIANIPSVNEVVVISKNDTDYVGRVIARGGDTVEVTEEASLIVNGNMVIEDKIYYATPQYEGFVEYPVKLASDEYFILADKREGGEDSRYFGPVKQSEIKGTVIGQFRRSGI